MKTYIISRILQDIPLLLIITFILFMLTQNIGDPLATMGGRQRIRAADRERLMRQFGLDQPAAVQYLYWLIGNDWTKVDRDGDGVAETPGQRKGVLRGDFGMSIVTRRPALDLIAERLPNTLLLMLPAEFLIIFFSLVVGVYSALRQYSLMDNFITTLSFIGYSMPVFWLALMLMYIFAVNFKSWGLPYMPTVGMFEPEVGKTTQQILWHMVLPIATLTIITNANTPSIFLLPAPCSGLTGRMLPFTSVCTSTLLIIQSITGLLPWSNTPLITARSTSLHGPDSEA